MKRPGYFLLTAMVFVTASAEASGVSCRREFDETSQTLAVNKTSASRVEIKFVNAVENQAVPGPATGLRLDSKTLLKTARENLQIWDLTTGQITKTLRNHGLNDIVSMDINPEGTRVATLAWDSLILYDTKTWKIIKSVPSNKPMIQGTHFVNNGTQLVSITNGSANLLDSVTGNVVKTFDGLVDRYSTIKFSPDGELLAHTNLGYNGKLPALTVVLKTLTGETKGAFPGEVLAVSPHGLVATKNGDKVAVYELNSSSLIYKLDSEVQATAATFSKDGHQFFLGREDGALLIFDIERL